MELDLCHLHGLEGKEAEPYCGRASVLKTIDVDHFELDKRALDRLTSPAVLAWQGFSKWATKTVRATKRVFDGTGPWKSARWLASHAEAK